MDARVYDRLAAAKREGESFSKVIDRLLTTVASTHTGRDILDRLSHFPALPEEESAVFLDVIAENRERETWERDYPVEVLPA